MTYLLKNNQKKKTSFWYPLFWTVVLSCLLYFFAMPLRVGLYTVLKPFLYIRSSVVQSITNTFSYFASKKTLTSENESLRSKLALFELQKTEYDLLAKENAMLKESFGRDSDRNMVLARILSKPPISPYDTLALDIGLTHGVALGSVVYTPSGGAVGTVGDISSTKSFVTLFSNPGTETELVLLRTGTHLTVRGEGGATMRVDVPRDADVVWGDVFTLPHIDPSVVGSVYYIDSEHENAFKSVYIRFPGNVWNSTYVLVEKIL